MSDAGDLTQVDMDRIGITRAELIERVSRKRTMTWQYTEVLVEAIFDSMVHALGRGERIEIRGFGTFQVRSYKGYKGRNPKTGKPIEVAPKRLPCFNASKTLVKRISQCFANPRHGPGEADVRDCPGEQPNRTTPQNLGNA